MLRSISTIHARSGRMLTIGAIAAAAIATLLTATRPARAERHDQATESEWPIAISNSNATFTSDKPVR